MQQPYPQQPTPYPQQPGIGYPQQGYPQQNQAHIASQGQALVPAPTQYVQPSVNVTQSSAVQRPRQNLQWDNYNAKGSIILGWIQIAISFISVILFAIGIHIQQYREMCYKNRAFYAGTGFWTSVFFILSGGFALGAGRRKTTCMIITNMIMSIISCVFAIALLGTSAAIIGIENDPYGTNDQGYSSSVCYYSDTRRPNDKFKMTGRAFGSIIVLVSLTEFIVCIMSSAFCCAAVCCGRRQRTTASQPVATGPPSNQPLMGQYPVHQPAQPLTQPQPYNPQYMAQSPHGIGQPSKFQEPSAPPPYEEAMGTKT